MQQRISDAELALMEVLWRESPLSAAEVADRIGTSRGWSFATIKTLLFRLREKGLLDHREEGRMYLYSPAATREAFVSDEFRRLVDRMLGGKLTPLVATFLREERLSTDEIAELEALLKEMKP